MPSLLLLSGVLASAQAQVPVTSTTSSSSQSGTTAGREGGPLGIGIAVGAPSGLAGRFYIADGIGLQFAAGGDLGRLGDVAATADFILLRQPFDTGLPDYSVLVYGGGGVNLGGNTFELVGEVLLGLRGVGGLTVQVAELPVDLSIELAPTLYLYDAVTWSIDGGLAVRYYF